MPEETCSTSPPPWRGHLPLVCSPLEVAAVMERLRRASQRGGLPGFRTVGEARFEASAFGSHFDRTLIGGVTADPQGSTIEFGARRHWKTLAGVWIVFALTLWPGVWLTHSMLLTWFGWYGLSMWGTVAWYVPLTLLGVPALMKVQRASDRASWAHAHETIEKIASLCAGTMVPPAHDSGNS